MSTRRVSLIDANGHLAELIEATKRGDEVVIEDDHSQFKLVAITPEQKPGAPEDSTAKSSFFASCLTAAKTAADVPPDLSENVDAYLYGGKRLPL